MILPKRGHKTTEFYVAMLAVVALVFGVVVRYDASVLGGAAVLAAYVLSRGIAKAGFGRAAHETGSRRVV